MTRISLLLAVALAAAVAAGAAGAAPVLVPQHRLPAEAVHLASPPTTSFCIANYGIHCYRPSQLIKAYDLGPLFASGIDGRGSTIVIVDSFGSPTIAHDLHAFDRGVGLPDPPSLKVFQPAGPVPPFDPNNDDMVGWAYETTLDVEWSHVFAPGANIVLLETPVSETEGVTGFPEIVRAENWAIDHGIGDVISMSFGATEQTFPNPGALLGLRSAFQNAYRHGVTLLAASGDTGATDYELNLQDLYPFPVTSWPPSDPLVTGVGGTMLTLDDNGNRLAPDVVWNDGFGAGGSGLSTVFGRPDFQDGVRSIVGHQRGVPDISMSAAVDGAVVYYESFAPTGTIDGTCCWDLIAGTSEASPEFAGIVADANQVARHRLGDINGALYGLSSLGYSSGGHGDGHGKSTGLVDVTQGNTTFGPFTNTDGNTYTVQGTAAGPGYDLASGVGTIDAARFVPALAFASQLDNR